LTIPREAIQTIGGRTVVYVSNPADPTRFIERDVVVGEAIGDSVRIESGVTPGDLVVAKGSFSLRAERERLGLGLTRPSLASVPGADHAQTARIEVADEGYRPTSVSFTPGVPARITFVRVSDKTCGTEVVIPSMNIRRQLPLNQAVNIDFTPKAGELEFICGMGMLKGSILVR
jgi:hypothetical protein